MSKKSILSLGNNLSTETQTKLQKLASKLSKVIVETPNTNNANEKADSNSDKTEKPKSQPEQLEKKRKAIELHKQQIEQSKALYKQHFSYFSKLYPNCFTQNPKPIAVGIHKVMLEEESKKPEEEQVDKTVISKFLSKYTRNVAYKECLQSGSARINLQGEEVDKVTAEHAEFAKKSLDDWRNKQAANKKNNKEKSRK